MEYFWLGNFEEIGAFEGVFIMLVVINLFWTEFVVY